MSSETSKSFHPSSAIITRADTPISDCVRLMQKHKVGSVLIVSDNASQQLVGIFTERDLLRTIELIKTGDYWEKPIRTVMQHPVKVLPVNKLSKAAEIMLKHGFRHLPVVDTDDKANFRVVGMVSMRDLLKDLVSLQNQGRKKTPAERTKDRLRTVRVGVVTLDTSLLLLIDHALSAHQITVDHLTLEHAASNNDRSDVIILDLDLFKADDWLEALRKINKRPIAPFTLVVFDPTRYTTKTIGVLNKLGGSKRFAAFAKPIATTALVGRIKALTRTR